MRPDVVALLGVTGTSGDDVATRSTAPLAKRPGSP